MASSSSQKSHKLKVKGDEEGDWLELGLDNCHHYHDNNDEDVDIDVYNGLPESSSSWPWHMDSGAAFLGLHDCQVPVPNDSHHYDSSTTRPHPGFWFTLRSSTNRIDSYTLILGWFQVLVPKIDADQDGEVLPQIPKAYIRVKDENVTVFMVKKYLVTKLGLSNEAEIDISCLGQNLLHAQTLKQVYKIFNVFALWETMCIELKSLGLFLYLIPC
nr:isoform 2 of e3 ubiquitin protein ligase drip1 [Quercus suber]